MHVRIRVFGKPDTIVVVESKLTKIDHFRRIIQNKFDVEPKLQRLFYGGKLLENGYTFHDYNIKLNDVIQLMVKTEPIETSNNQNQATTSKTSPDQTINSEKKQNDESKNYKDTESTLYEVGDIIDMRHREEGAWYEGKITRIVYDPDIPYVPDINASNDYLSHTNSCGSNESIGKENYDGNKLPNNTNSDSTSKTEGIEIYFMKLPKNMRKKQSKKKSEEIKQLNDTDLLYKVELDDKEWNSPVYCKLHEIRPRARNVIDVNDLRIGHTVMINYNTEDPLEIGLWYDFKVSKIKKLRAAYELIGTLYLGPEAIPQSDTKVRLKDKIFAIEEVVPLKQRSNQYKELIATIPEKRTAPLKCLTCRDDGDMPCKDCGCYQCSGKEYPDKIMLCDECNKGYHMQCLDPPLTEVPEDDWYCSSCKRDTKEVIAPGAAKQTKKTLTTKRDWGRGMACVGKTKTCAMPANHFGPIPGIEVGMSWRFRIQLSETGVHRPPVSGIHGRDVDGAYSIVLSGGYEDDVDFGNEFTYTGSGGRDLSGNKRTAEQSCDQTLTRENKALARNCAVKQISEEGGDAGEDWRHGKPVRVVRSYKMLKHFPKYAPKEGNRYDGIYKVVKYYSEKGLSGYRVWKYLLRRDDPTPAPWEPNAKKYPIVYPDGYLEAEAEKRALIEKKKDTRKTKRAFDEELKQVPHKKSKVSPPVKTQKSSLNEASIKKSTAKKRKGDIADIFKKSPSPKKKLKKEEDKTEASPLTTTEREVIEGDTLNSKLWQECLVVCDTQGKKEFVEYVTQMFLCIICQEVAVSPVTTPCLHNFCMSCIKMAFKTTGMQCPCCRQSLANFEININEKLQTALRCVMTGYDAGKK